MAAAAGGTAVTCIAVGELPTIPTIPTTMAATRPTITDRASPFPSVGSVTIITGAIGAGDRRSFPPGGPLAVSSKASGFHTRRFLFVLCQWDPALAYLIAPRPRSQPVHTGPLNLKRCRNCVIGRTER